MFTILLNVLSYNCFPNEKINRCNTVFQGLNQHILLDFHVFINRYKIKDSVLSKSQFLCIEYVKILLDFHVFINHDKIKDSKIDCSLEIPVFVYSIR